METRVEELEDKMGLVQTKLQKVVTRLDKLDMLDFEKINGVKERLLMIEEGLMNILNHLNIGIQRNMTPSPKPVPEISHVALAAKVVNKGKAVLQNSQWQRGRPLICPLF